MVFVGNICHFSSLSVQINGYFEFCLKKYAEIWRKMWVCLQELTLFHLSIEELQMRPHMVIIY